MFSEPGRYFWPIGEGREIFKYKNGKLLSKISQQRKWLRTRHASICVAGLSWDVDSLCHYLLCPFPIRRSVGLLSEIILSLQFL